MRFADTDPMNRTVFPLDEWALVESEFGVDDMGRTETLFAVGNGYLGLRGNVEEGRDGHMHGTFVNGFHETWPIRHAEEAFGFARVGQTIVNAPDAKVIRLSAEAEPEIHETTRRFGTIRGLRSWRSSMPRIRSFSRRA